MNKFIIGILSGGLIIGATVSVARAVEIGFATTKNIFDVEILPGGSYTDDLAAFNITEATLPIAIEISPWNLKEDSDEIEFIVTEPGLNSALWFDVKPKNFILEGKDGSRKIDFTITPPDDVSPGTYLAMMRLEATLPEHYFEENGMRSIPELGVLFFIKIPSFTLEGTKISYTAEILGIESEEERVGNLFLGEAKAGVFDSAIKKLTAKVKNNGVYFFKSSGYLEIKNIFGKTVKKVELSERYLLPNRIRSLDIEVVPPPENLEGKSWFSRFLRTIYYTLDTNSYVGPYTATLTLSVPNEPPIVKTVSFWVIPWKFWLPVIIGLFLIIFFIKKFGSRLKIAIQVLLKAGPPSSPPVSIG
ncbi:MAG: hypothetical protein A3H06_01340 [Candidatus Colwellbacteria bacterium RIFCSPLOWO2_12_FULL_44_13]|uniref:Uncharacterized protein n=3 Tax=Candidatus Colwelliibacteriota TaxID=1817904 RepID=A0A1G1Z757_9BACT|nr:MAG: hypothetical protein A3F24_00565 [Candidatus Colwellbacteria bacterium RIFCSPHIGHO2_12_FULL_44_17]OGY60472.1 MAG: hypothetical protein A3I31_01710 [Candidatus Colwellbacteria bacterium RIFCSPLOWO2_02_FULL_44_20b]OGY62003.1 MAG: hypothetical protein A3H06_01340 [Candidatus Colwellbacteria bacterium RIFCSPLOWO2_12_FULL_44_13]